ncbi:LuxR C-terminal-related transcriptional regulator [Actinoplanes sp. NPDC026619]|uniref:LuxR C-terminal-related transcriptional regulator n=1 Tax=Actinoplanes sp. NPDC026619 TaxID=3155798 RepID=UPI0033F7842C
MSTPLLAVKHTIPPVRDAVVPRTRLESRLDTATKLTVVAAPAGWGKTSLVSRWAAATGTPVAWVSLDENDDEPVRFWSYVLTALRQVSDLGPAAAEALLAAGDGLMSQALPLLLNELAASPAEHVLVLDDYHVITDRTLHDSLEFLVTYLPPALRVVLLSRADPPLPLARMRVRGELTELRAEDLRFSRDESAALLSAVAATEVAAAEAAALTDQTEGWAAGLQLAGLALRGRRPLRADDRHLFDYFTAEVLPSLTPAQRDLLVRAAPLELLSGSLCDAALGVHGSAAVLAELERADLFVVALDAGHEWYRCHRLLRNALGWSPEFEPGDVTRVVLRRAAGWFEQHDRPDDAIRCFLDAGDDEAAAGPLADRHQWFLARGWAATYQALGERLPETAVTPQLALNLTYAAEVSGNRDRVAHWLDVCARQIGPDTVVEGWRSPRAAEFSLRGLLATDPADPTEAVALAERSVALEAAAGTEDHPVALMSLGVAYGLAGRFADGARLLAETWRMRGRGQWSRGVDLQVAGQLSLHLLALQAHDELDGLLADAVPAADAAEQEWGEAAAAHLVMTTRLVEGRRRYQRGDAPSAAVALARGLRFAEIAGHPHYQVLGHLFLADTELAAGSRAGARAALVRAREVADNDPVAPFLLGWLEAAENRIGRSAARATGALAEELTDRELSILRMLPGTATQREIGAALFLSINTVKAYNKSLYRKLGVGGRQDAVRAARRLGLI